MTNYAQSNQPVSDGDMIEIVQQNSLVRIPVSALVKYFTGNDTYGRNPNSLKRFRTALAGTLTGASRTRILCIGDSTTFGVGSNGHNGAGGGDMQPTSYPTMLASVLSTMGYPANAHSIAGMGSGSFESRFTNDGRFTVGNSWSLYTAGNGQTLGGCMALATTGTNALSFTPSGQCDSFKIWGIKYSANGTLSAKINAGTATTHSFAGTPTGIDSFTITGTLGANTLNLTWSSGGTTYVSAIEAWNSALPQICITNAGWPGAKVADISANSGGDSGSTYNPVQLALAYAPDLYIVSIGINDWTANTDINTWVSQLTTFVTTIQATADVILVSPAPSATSAASVDTQNKYVQAMKKIASDHGCVFVDNWGRLGLWADNNAMYANLPTPGNLHPNGLGYTDFAHAIARTIAGS